ncbi:MAG: glycosyltransferase family 4 protein [Ferruginibacter sp.]|nr:glycosyltransferase family 4 protein [Cytophagales bacterium]
MKVLYFQRKRANKGHFSIESLFDSIRKNLPSSIQTKVVISSFVNSGVFKRLFNILEIPFKEKGDINHVTGDIHYVTFLMRKRKTILTIHDVNLLYTPSALKKFIHSWFWLKIPILRSHVITVISHATKEEVLKYTNCPPDKIRVIYNCISSKFLPVPKVFNKEKPTLLQIGTRDNKNLSRVIEAIAGLACKLDIVGEPPAETLRLLATHRIDFSWRANLTDQEMIQKYVDCDILIFVSIYEGFGLPIIEANTVERPVITSNRSSMAEIAGDAACLVDPLDVQSIRRGVIRVIEDDQYRQALLERGKRNRERFQPEAVAQQYFKLYQELLIP